MALAASHGHAAFVSQGQLAHQPQAQTHAAALRRRGVLVTLEDAFAIGRGDSDPMVADRDPDPRARRPLHDQADRASLTELQRVGQQVGDDLFDGRRVPPPIHAVWRYDDRHPLRAGERRQQALGRRADRRADFHESRPQGGSAGPLQLGHGVDQRLQPLNLRPDHAQRGHHDITGQTRNAALRNPDVEQGRRDRRAQLVAYQLHGIGIANDVPMVFHPAPSNPSLTCASLNCSSPPRVKTSRAPPR